jgi:hypothetical protein
VSNVLNRTLNDNDNDAIAPKEFIFLAAKSKSFFPDFIASPLRRTATAAASIRPIVPGVNKQYGPAMTGLTAIAKLAGLWVDQTANINGNYAISDKPLTEQECVEKHVKD